MRADRGRGTALPAKISAGFMGTKGTRVNTSFKSQEEKNLQEIRTTFIR
jgi:hypothetical protein